jgi:nitroimidazol reductase NimA-like FMN-containing flavoprotein (pyridoxamine 5'-phosphate oxidase superfamily)
MPSKIEHMVVLKKSEVEFLESHELCRFATASKEGIPHVVPVIYAMDGEDVIIAIDYSTKKLKNLRENKEVALVVDDYNPNDGIMVQGSCRILERGKEYLRLQQILYKRFEYYRNNPWKEGESPIIKVHPRKAVSW